MTDVDVGLFGALAGVSAITTALQAAVALQPLSDAYGIRRGLRGTTPTSPRYSDLVGDAKRRFWTLLGLNLPALLVNGSVLAAWGRVAVWEPSPEQWWFWLPWVAVVIVSVTLGFGATFGLRQLRELAKKS